MNLINFTTTYTDRERGKHLTFEDRCNIKVFRKSNIPYVGFPMN